jgi:hypothetical protein
MTLRAQYVIVSKSADQLTIRDMNGDRTVTNDAEQVVAQLLLRGDLTPGMRLFYYDSAQELDEITFTADGFTGFKYLSVE